MQPNSTSHRDKRNIQPRQPHPEIAELLAAAVVRMRSKESSAPFATNCETQLGFTAYQSVNANPSQTEGVHA